MRLELSRRIMLAHPALDISGPRPQFQVSSRAFRLRGPNKPASMLPLIDVANHSFDHNVKARTAAYT